MLVRNIMTLGRATRIEAVPRKYVLWNAVRYKHAKNHGHGTGATTLPDHAPEWDESLATASEAHVKADQAPIKPTAQHTIQTLKRLDERLKVTDDTVSLSAAYEKDEVGGPLKDKGKKKEDAEKDVDVTVKVEINGAQGSSGGKKDN